MQLITDEISRAMAGGSFIRRMFETGLKLKAQFGDENVFDFSLGNPDVPPPASAKRAIEQLAAKAIEPLGVGYCPNAGIPEVRTAIAGYITRQQGVAVGAGDVVMTVGAAGAITAFFRAVLEKGDEVITPSPYFVEYGSYCGHFGGVLKPVDSRRPSFQLNVPAIAAAIMPKTRAIIVNSPNNPTGVVYEEGDLKALAEVVEKENAQREARGDRPLFILSDEPYRVFVYDGKQVPPLFPISRWLCVLGSFSKSLSLPGERIGYFAVNPAMPGKDELIAAVTLTNRTLGFVNAPVLGQRLAMALVDETVDLSIYERRRAAMLEVLTHAGIEFPEPAGAFYIFAKSPVEDERVFVDELLKENILVVPGRGFGAAGYVRLCYAVDEAIIRRSAAGFKRAVDRLTAK